MVSTPMVEYVNPTQYLFEILEWQEDNGRFYWEDDKTKVLEDDKKLDNREQSTVIQTTAPYMPDEWEIVYIAKMAYAENQTESDYSCRLVIDTVINRVRHEDFPDTYYGVLSQRNQFQTWTEGKIQSAPATERMMRLVREELNNQTGSREILYFTADCYNPYCKPMFNIDNVYFGR